jgi:hypothetical protein
MDIAERVEPCRASVAPRMYVTVRCAARGIMTSPTLPSPCIGLWASSLNMVGATVLT